MAHQEMVSVRDTCGHDSEEDASACVDLLWLKDQNRGGFGDFKPDHESIFERMVRACGGVVRGM